MLILAGLNPRANLAASTRPNIILILTDDMGYGDLGCYGGKLVPTPNIDQLANEGTRFTQYYAASPICSPSRTGLLTGMFPARWNIHSFLQTRDGNRRCGQADFLDPKAPSIARTLRSAGYATAHIGKWHLGGGRDVTNAPPIPAYGFDEHVSTYESPNPDPNLTATNWIWSAQDSVKRWDRTGYFVDKIIDFLKRHRAQPCYVNLWPDDVHTPWVAEGLPRQQGQAAGENEEHFKKVLAEYDRQIGRLMAGLRELGLDTNTIIVFTSDNGPMPDWDHQRTAGFRGRKASLYEGGIRMPLIVRWPGQVPAGRVNQRAVINAVDFFPIFCKLGRTSLPHGTKFDGEDLSPALLGKKQSRKQAMFWEYGRNDSSYAYPPAKDRSPSLALRDGKWKLLLNPDTSGVELYDLDADPHENENVAAHNPALAKRLSERLLNWKQSLP